MSTALSEGVTYVDHLGATRLAFIVATPESLAPADPGEAAVLVKYGYSPAANGPTLAEGEVLLAVVERGRHWHCYLRTARFDEAAQAWKRIPPPSLPNEEEDED